MKRSHLTHKMILALEGSLPEGEREQLMQDIQSDPDLAREWQEMNQLSELMGKQQFSLKPFLATRVQARLDAKSAPKALPWRRAFEWVTLPVAALAIGLMAFTFFQEQEISLDSLSGRHDLSVEEIWVAEWTPETTFDP